MKSIVVLTPADTSPGFTLAGVKQHALADEDVRETLAAQASDASNGLIAIDERLVTPAIQRELDTRAWRWPALVVVLPAPTAAEISADDYALRLIRRAIGYQVRVHV